MNLDFLVPLLYPAAVLAFAAAMWKPQIGIYYLAVVLPLQTLRYQLFEYPFGGSLIDVVLLGSLIGVWLSGHAKDLSNFSLRWILLALSVYSYLSLWYGSMTVGLWLPTSTADPRVSTWKSWTEFGVICLTCFLAIRTRKQIVNVILLMCVTSAALSWDFFMVMSSRDLSHYASDLQYSGVLGYANPNGFAAFEAMTLLFVVGLAGRGLTTPLKCMLPPAILACSYGVLFAFSRGTYLGVAAGLLALGLLRRKFAVALVIGALGVGAMFAPSSVTDRVSGTYAAGSNSTDASLDSSAMDRVAIWQNAVELFVSHPILGSGFDTYEYMHPLGFKDTHNFYVKILVEQGVAGFLLFAGLIAAMMRQGMALVQLRDGAFLSSLGIGFVVCLIGALVVNFFGDRWSYIQVDSYMWMLLALVCRARKLQSEPEEVSVPGEFKPDLEAALAH